MIESISDILIITDVDGTLLHEKDGISKENLEAIKKLGEMGIIFVPCTGRTFAEVPEEIRELPGVRYVIHSGGAVVFDKKTGDPLLCGSPEIYVITS